MVETPEDAGQIALFGQQPIEDFGANRPGPVVIGYLFSPGI
jgi:hypothetical protein